VQSADCLVASMVEPLLHFVVPFVSLRAVGVDLRKAMFASVVALTPDLDVAFNTHRSPTHSVVVLGLVLLAFLLLTWKRKTARPLVLLAAFGVFSHLLLDLFQTSTPLFWPLVSQSVSLWPNPDFHMWSGVLVWYPGSWLDAPLITAEGLGISFLLLAPTIVQIVRRGLADRKRGRVKPVRYYNETRVAALGQTSRKLPPQVLAEVWSTLQ